MVQTLRRYPSTHAAAAVVALFTSVSLVFGQTKIVAPENKYSVQDDVKAGREAAQEVTQQLPMLRDDGIDSYVERVGQRLVENIPSEFRHQQFRYTFDVVNVSDLNAFALPGGPMYINRGMLQAAKNEGEVAGVLAHEISHVALRHGTAQAGKATPYQVGSILGQIAGAIIGGGVGQVISLGSQVIPGTVFLKYGREYERQSDLLGAQIMARAGYDPRQMANMFKTIEAEGGGSGPEWMSSHPNPGNRYEAINREAAMLRVESRPDTGEFQTTRSRLTGMSPAPTAEQIARRGNAGGGGSAPSRNTNVRVEPPSTSQRTFRPGDFLRVTVPSNWNQIDTGEGGVTYAPEGGYLESNDGRSAFTHGVQFGVAQGASGNLQRDTEQLLQNFARSNPNLRAQGSRRDSLGGRSALTTTLSNRSDVNGRPELVTVSTTQLRNGNMLFVIAVAPESEYDNYEGAFRRVRQGLQISDR